MNKLKHLVALIAGAVTVACTTIALADGPLPPAPVLHCFDYFSDSASFCTSDSCGQSAPLAPYQGKTKHLTWQCCYKPDGTLDSAKKVKCTDQVVSSPNYPYGCCSSVTASNDVPDCPAQSCPSTHAIPPSGPGNTD